MFKTANVGSLDRLIRIVIGALLIALPFIHGAEIWANPLAQWGAMIVGSVLILTALVRFCPLYCLIGTSNCKTN